MIGAPTPSRSVLTNSPAVLTGLIAMGVLLWWAAAEGGFPQGTWYPGALILGGVLVVGLLTLPRIAKPPRAVLVAVGLMFAYAAWSYLSIAWADQKGDAVDGAGRTLLFAIVFALFALWPLRRRAGALLLGAIGLGIAAVGLVELIRMNAAADPSGYFIFARFSEPVGYQNANVALWSAGLFPCIALATRMEVAWWLRGVALGSSGLLAGLALMGQSRGWLFAVPAAIVIFLVLVPDRVRAAACLLGVAAAVAACAGPVLDLSKVNDPDADPAALVSSAARALLIASIVLGALGAAAAYAERRRPPSRAAMRSASRGLAAIALLAVLAGAAAFVVKEGNPVDKVSGAWSDFTEKGSPKVAPGESRFNSNLGSDRYDFWKVGVDAWEKHPIQGIGADNFQQVYLREGKAEEIPRYPHSVEIRALVQTGLVGVLLLGGAIVAALLVGLRAVRRARDLGSAVAAASIAGFAYWLLHGSVDWFWEFPVLGGAAFAMLGLATAMAPRYAAGNAPLMASRGSRAGLAVGALAGLVLLGAPWLSNAYVDRASGEWPANSSAAFDDLDRAATLDPVASRPYTVGATIALALGDVPKAKEQFEKAVDRDPDSFFANLELGAIESAQGNARRAELLLTRARALSPRDELARGALGDVRAGRRVDLAALGDSLAQRAENRLGRR